MRIRIKRLFEKTVVPRYQVRGYGYEYRGANHYRLTNELDSIHVEYEVPHYVTNGFQALLSVKYGYQWEFLPLNDLAFFDPPIPNIRYFEGQEEFCEASALLTDDVFQALDHLESIVDELIPRQARYYELLADDTQRQAADFAASHGRSLVDPMQGLGWCKGWLYEHISLYSDAESRKQSFENNLSEMLGFCAYFGETYRAQTGGLWSWGERHIDGHSERLYWVTEIEDTNIVKLDPLNIVIRHLNFAPEFRKALLWPELI